MFHTIKTKHLLWTLIGVTLLSIAGCSKGSEDVLPNSDNGQTDNPSTNNHVVTAYCTWYGSTLPNPKYVTNINYAFAEVYVVNGVYKGFKLEGEESRFQQVVNLKKANSSLKISLSFTHVVENSDNKQDGGFSAIAASDIYRQQFAEDCLSFIKKWGIDGIDIDWEYPGLSWSGAASDPANDVNNFTLLMKQLRTTLGNNYLLTFAGYVRDKVKTTKGYKYMDLAAVAPYVDYIYMMTYDMDSAPHHHSALSDTSCYWDCKRTVESYATAGVPYSKMLLGIPFYGRHSFSESPAAITYKNILNLSSSYKIDNWDAKAQVPYVTKDGVFFCGYDNPQSIAIKGAWILGLGMRGMFYWECSQDDAAYTLAKAVWNATIK